METKKILPFGVFSKAYVSRSRRRKEKYPRHHEVPDPYGVNVVRDKTSRNDKDQKTMTLGTTLLKGKYIHSRNICIYLLNVRYLNTLYRRFR